jgi:hypothetical protein
MTIVPLKDRRSKIGRRNNEKSVICLVTKVRCRRVLALYLKILDPGNRTESEQVVEGVMNMKGGQADQERGMQYVWLQGRHRITPVLPRSC